MKHKIILAIVGICTIVAAAGCFPHSLDVPRAPERAAVAGAIVDHEKIGRMPVPGSPMVSADVYRFSYVTRSDTTQVATARLAVPVTAGADYDMVAHLHGTIGFADHCAPSRMPGFGFEAPLNQIPADMVADGRVVVMPDYPGLGAPGRHRYVEKEATGRSVWDAFTAAQSLMEERYPERRATGRVLLMGHSQGGHAAMAALATQHPDDPWNLVGTVALAPPGDPLHHARLVALGEANAGPLAWALMSYSIAYPDEVDRDALFEEWVVDSLPSMMEEYCIPTIKVWLGNDPEDIFTEEALEMFANRTPSPELASLIERERLDTSIRDSEVVVFHGNADDLLPMALSSQLADRLADNGNRVAWHEVDGAGHLTVPHHVRHRVGALADERFGAGNVGP